MPTLRETLCRLLGCHEDAPIPPAPSPGPTPPPSPTPTPPPPSPSPGPTPPPPTFYDDFSSGRLDTSKWQISTWGAPGGSATHTGTFVTRNVTFVDGMLCLVLNQGKTGSKYTSECAEIATLQKFSYGTYEFEVRASSTAATSTAVGNPVSGSITGCFSYATNAETEIDIEVEGNERHPLTQCTTWNFDSEPNEHHYVPPSDGVKPHQAFFRYKYIWEPGKVRFYRNDVLIATHTEVVGTKPASFLFNHWGTNDTAWGGNATINTKRYMYIKNFKFTAR